MERDPRKMPENPEERTEQEFRDRMRARRNAMSIRIKSEEALLRFRRTCKLVGLAVGVLIILAIGIYFY